jgi:hypothetical protein
MPSRCPARRQFAAAKMGIAWATASNQIIDHPMTDAGVRQLLQLWPVLLVSVLLGIAIGLLH